MTKLTKNQKIEIIELETMKSSKLVWGLINIFLLSWLIVPLIIGIIQIVQVVQLDKEIKIMKLG